MSEDPGESPPPSEVVQIPLEECSEPFFPALPAGATQASSPSQAWIAYTPRFEAEQHVADMPLMPWAGHRCFAYDLTCFARPRRIVELGVYNGTSLFAFAQAVKDLRLACTLVGVDTWEGDVHGGYYGDEVLTLAERIRKDFYGELEITLVRRRFSDAVDLVADESIDLLHIDGLHTYEAALADFKLWLPKLAPTGVVLFHDVHTTFTVSELWKELRDAHPHFEFRHSFGLGVLFPKDASLYRRMREGGFLAAEPRYELYSRFDRARTRLRLERRADEALGGRVRELEGLLAAENGRAEAGSVARVALERTLSTRVAEATRLAQELSARDAEAVRLGRAEAELLDRVRVLERERAAALALGESRARLRAGLASEGGLSSEAALPYFVVYGPDHVAGLRASLLPALAAQSIDRRREVYLVNYLENQPLLGPGDSTLDLTVHDVSQLRAPGRLGFGKAVNTLFELVQPPTLFYLLNPDTVPKPDFSSVLLSAFDPEHTGICEARQWPSEHPKEFDPETGETPWASGACLLVSSEAFQRVGGFDPAFFLYCEDVDLSWRMWLAGRRVVHVRDAIAEHHTGFHSYAGDRFYAEHFYSAIGFLLLCYKYFGAEGEARGIRLLAEARYPADLHARLLRRYHEAKRAVRRLPVAPVHPHIKILGFNLYHELRTA